MSQKFQNIARISDTLIKTTKKEKREKDAKANEQVNPLQDKQSKKRKPKKSKPKATSKVEVNSDSDDEVGRTRKYQESEAYGILYWKECKDAVDVRIKELEEAGEKPKRIVEQRKVVAERWGDASDDVKQHVREEMAKDSGIAHILEDFPKIAELTDDARSAAIEAVQFNR